MVPAGLGMAAGAHEFQNGTVDPSEATPGFATNEIPRRRSLDQFRQKQPWTALRLRFCQRAPVERAGFDVVSAFGLVRPCRRTGAREHQHDEDRHVEAKRGRRERSGLGFRSLRHDLTLVKERRKDRAQNTVGPFAETASEPGHRDIDPSSHRLRHVLAASNAESRQLRHFL